MYLAENRILRLTTLCALYVAQGIPWGFVTVTFAAWLADPEQGLSTTEIGPILAVATLPWSFKFLWGPVMDRYTIPSIGRRRPWIIFAQVMAIIVLSSMVFIRDPAAMIWTVDADASKLRTVLITLVPGPLAAMILLANVFVSMQDVAVDALAVDLLEDDERSTANGMMYGCSYLGTAIGGAGLGRIVSLYGIQAGMICQAALLCLIVLLPIVVRERRRPSEQEGRPPGNDVDAATELKDVKTTNNSSDVAADDDVTFPLFARYFLSGFGLLSVFLRWFFQANEVRAFRLRSTMLGAILALGVRIGIGVLTAVFVDFLLKDGGWSQAEYTEMTGGWVVFPGLAAAIGGGRMADRFGAKQMIAFTSVALGSLWIAFGLFPEAIESRRLVQVLLLTQETMLAMMSVSLFGLFMDISWPKVGATQFTTYMALMNLSTTVGSYIAGVVSGAFGIHEILILAGLLQIIMLLPLPFIDPSQTRRELGDGYSVSR